MPQVLPSPAPPRAQISSLLARAEQKLAQRERTAQLTEETVDAKKERVTVVLLSAMEIASEEASSEGLAELERAIEAAQASGVLPELRVRARKLLAEHQAEQKRFVHLEERLSKLIAHAEHTANELEAAEEEEVEKKSDDMPSPRVPAQHVRKAAEAQRKAAIIRRQLARAIDEAKNNKLSDELIEQAEVVIERIDRDQQIRESNELRLKHLLSLKDLDQIDEELELAQTNDTWKKGNKAKKIFSQLAERVNTVYKQEQHQLWLDNEVETAIASEDAHRLRQLVSQSKLLDLRIAPTTLSFLHELEARDYQSSLPDARGGKFAAIEDTKTPRSEDHARRVEALAQRRREATDKVLRYVEDDPTLAKIDEAKRAVSDAKAFKLPLDTIAAMEKRLVALDESHGPRLRAEEKLLSFLKSSDLISFEEFDYDGGDGPVLQDMSTLVVLKEILSESRRLGVMDDLLHAGEALLDRSSAFESQQRKAAETLREMLKNPIKNDSILEQLHLAIDKASRLGISTLHAERELLRLREALVHREVSEAELREARKGHGAQGKARLEAAIQAAKTAGVGARKLRAANNRIVELDEHQQKCALVAGNVRRMLPDIESEPWKFQQMLEKAKILQPWTPELEKLAKVGQERVDKHAETQARQKEVQSELQALLKKIVTDRANGQLHADEAVQLTEVLAKSRKAHVTEELISEAEAQLKTMKREGCQRTVAEHRLRLALNSKDYTEIEKSLREVRALGQAVVADSSNAAKNQHQNQPQSARLIEAANSMLRHLGDVASRRQAAEAALLSRIADTDGQLPYFQGSVVGGDVQATSATSQQGTDAWVKEIMDAVHEAKQSGVAPSLIEHAKQKIRKKRRERHEELKALSSLKKTLVKKDASTQELLRNMRRVERFAGQSRKALGSARQEEGSTLLPLSL